MKLKLDDHEYTIRIRPAAYPHLQTLSAAFTTAPPSKDELVKAEAEAIELCVEPKPCEDHVDMVVAAVIQRYAEIMRNLSRTFRP